MKTRFTAHGYFRTILLSVLAACTIEAFVNADEVQHAFIAGRKHRQEVAAAARESSSWLQLPQKVSRLAGVVYQVVFE